MPMAAIEYVQCQEARVGTIVIGICPHHCFSLHGQIITCPLRAWISLQPAFVAVRALVLFDSVCLQSPLRVFSIHILSFSLSTMPSVAELPFPRWHSDRHAHC